MDKNYIILDAEFDSLTPTKVWVVTFRKVEDRLPKTFRLDHYGFDHKAMALAIKSYLDENSPYLLIGCNLVKFDMPELNKLMPEASFPDVSKLLDNYSITSTVLDLQILSRLIWFERPGGHSVEEWAKRFNKHKPEIPVYDRADMIPEYVERCEADVDITLDIWNTLKRHFNNKNYRRAIEIEHSTAWIAREMEVNGFGFNVKEAEKLQNIIEKELEVLSQEIIAEVGDVVDEVRTYTLRRNKDGTMHALSSKVLNGIDTGYKHGDKYEKTFYRPFNPGSPKDRIDYLNAVGWKPVDKTKTHKQCERELREAAKNNNFKEAKRHKERMERFKTYGWEVSEGNLKTLPKDAPQAARKLTEWLTLNGRLTFLKTWLGCVRPGEQRGKGSIHGGFLHIGAWTHRMSHYNPNQGNIFGIPHLPKGKTFDDMPPPDQVKLKYDKKLRSLWEAKPNRILVGTDAEGIQLRILAHYMKDPEYADAVANGRKEDKTDVHNVNLRALGMPQIVRDDAKTFNFRGL